MQLKTHAESAHGNGAFLARKYIADTQGAQATPPSTSTAVDLLHSPMTTPAMTSPMPELEPDKVGECHEPRTSRHPGGGNIRLTVQISQ